MDKILKANQIFYDAFAAGDFGALKSILSETQKMSVVHPGSEVIHGREAVLNSWRQILQNSGGNSIKCSNAMAYIHGEMAYVVCEEVFPEGQLIATNVFIMEHGEWRMVHHQAGPNPGNRTRTESSRSLH